MGLTDRQRKFAQNIVKGMTQVESYRKAGYSVKSQHAGEVSAARLLKNAGVQEYISKLREAAENDTVLSVQAKREFLAGLVRLKITDLIEAQSGTVDIPDDLADFVSALETQEKINENGDVWGFTKKLKLHDKLRAIEIDNKLAGHNAPEKHETEAGPGLLEWIREHNGQG